MKTDFYEIQTADFFLTELLGYIELSPFPKVLEIEPRASHKLGKFSTTELHPSPRYKELTVGVLPLSGGCICAKNAPRLARCSRSNQLLMC
jgi:hypothetical protein